eukprot:scaffold15059_cov22-Tisochrysis_lutea.AAC.1
MEHKKCGEHGCLLAGRRAHVWQNFWLKGMEWWCVDTAASNKCTKQAGVQNSDGRTKNFDLLRFCGFVRVEDSVEKNILFPVMFARVGRFSPEYRQCGSVGWE